MSNIAADTFTDADGTALATHDAKWLLDNGTNGLKIQSNRCTVGFAETGVHRYNQAPGTADYSVSIDIILTGASTYKGGVKGRASGASDYYLATYNNGNWVLESVVGGSATSLGSSAASSSAGTYNLKLQMSGSAISLYVDGSVVVGPVTDTSFSAAGLSGINLSWAGGTGFVMDNFSADTLSSGITTAIASTETGDTFAGAAAVTLPTSTIAATETGDTIAASVTVTQPALSIAATEDGDSFVAQAVVVGGTLTSDIVVTEAGDSFAGVVAIPSTAQANSGGAKKKHHVPNWDTVWLEPEKEIPIEVIQDPVKALAKDNAEEIISHSREIGRIKTQMRLSSNKQALSALENEIEKIEKHIAKTKRESEDTLLLMLLL